MKKMLMINLRSSIHHLGHDGNMEHSAGNGYFHIAFDTPEKAKIFQHSVRYGIREIHLPSHLIVVDGNYISDSKSGLGAKEHIDKEVVLQYFHEDSGTPYLYCFHINDWLKIKRKVLRCRWLDL